MAKIPAAKLIASFRRMLDERWPYVAGGSDESGVDCSGAFVWAYRQEGKSIYHGSNRMAREEVETLYPVGSVQVVPGMAAFKHRTPLDAGYALPSGYQAGGSHYNGDLNDYYHVGLVDKDTTRVLNAQSASAGFVASDIGKGWTHVGYLKQADYGERGEGVGVTCSDTAVTTAPSGSTVNLRRSASKASALVERIPLGTTVTLRGPEMNGWVPVRWGKKEGWVMAEFLRRDRGDQTVPAPEGYSSWAVTFYDLSYEQAVGLQSEMRAFRSRLEGRNG